MNYLFFLIAILIISSVRTDLNDSLHVTEELEIDANYENTTDSSFKNGNKTTFTGTFKDDNVNDTVGLRIGFDHEFIVEQNKSNVDTTVESGNLTNASISLRSNFLKDSNDNKTTTNSQLNDTKNLQKNSDGQSNLTTNGTIGLENEFDHDSFGLRNDFAHILNENQNKRTSELNGTSEKILSDFTSLRNDFSEVLNENKNKSDFEPNGRRTLENDTPTIKKKVMNLVTDLQDDLNKKILSFKENLRNAFNNNTDTIKTKADKNNVQ